MPENTIENSQSVSTWMLPPRKTGGLKPGLYLVATPIGNMGDITVRALDVLAACDVVLCEDTRVSGKLLSHFGLKKKLQLYNDHSDEKTRTKIIAAIEKGAVLALMSDAGMPLISDPGYKLMQACQDAGVYATSVPGANAPLTAMQLSGLPTDRFCFLGFLPVKSNARITYLQEWANIQASLVVFENASRVTAALRDIKQALGERDVAIVRELTKMYEEVLRGHVSDLIESLDEKRLKGEVVLVIEGSGTQVFAQEDIEALVKEARKTKSTKEAARHVASQSGWSRKDVYEIALKLGKED